MPDDLRLCEMKARSPEKDWRMAEGSDVVSQICETGVDVRRFSELGQKMWASVNTWLLMAY